MARILMLTQYFPPEIGAAQVRLQAIASELAGRGHDVTVVTAMPSYPEGRIHPSYRNRLVVRERVDDVNVIRTWVVPGVGAGFRRLVSYASFVITGLVGCFLSKRPDLIFVETPPTFLGLTALIYSRLRSVPYVLNVADLWVDAAAELGLPAPAVRASLWLERQLHRRAWRVTAATEGFREVVVARSGLPPDGVFLLPNGVDTELFRPQPPDPEWFSRLNRGDRPIFLYLGTHGYIHGLDVVLDAAKLTGDQAQFTLVGGGSDKQRLVTKAKEMHLDNVIFLDSVPQIQASRVLSVCRAALVTVRASNTSSRIRSAKMFPAMASGKAVIYSADDEGAALVSAADCGLVVPPGDGAALARAVLALADDPAEAQRLGARGRALVERDYTWHGIVGRWLSEMGLPEK
jgi:putative colanic acid biosynthesis glycosyltransferase WcaI